MASSSRPPLLISHLFFLLILITSWAVYAVVAESTLHTLPHHLPKESLATSTNTESSSFLRSTLFSFSMIIISELGDKTFFISAILAMRHPRLPVFLGASTSLWFMSILSALMGQVLPNVLPRKWVGVCAAGLFFVFAIKMLLEVKSMNGDEGKEEMEEVEKELLQEEQEQHILDAEAGGSHTSHESKPRHGLQNLISLLLSPIFVQAFVLVFFAEWGDRSQIATIALAAAQDAVSVTLGTVLGHTACTALAVIGGKLLAERISVKGVSIAGAMLFAVFGVVYVVDAFVYSSY